MDVTDGNTNDETYFTGQKIECPYTDKCIKYPSCCGTCKRNTAKKDYYIPDKDDWYVPYPQPYTWWYPYEPIIWCSTCDGSDNYECHIYDDC